MNKINRNFIEGVAKIIDLQEPIIEIGSLQVKGQEEIANLRPLFRDKNYIGCDIRPGRGVDRIEDVERLDFYNNSVGTVIMLNTLEHVKNPFDAMKEINRVLRPEGILVMSSVMNFPIHDYPSDYWRFTPEAFRLLVSSFKSSFVDFDGEEKHPHTIIAIASNQEISPSIIDQLKTIEWKEKKDKCNNKIKLFIPPIFLILLSFLKKLKKSK